AICMDFDIMEPARILALKGADVICLPTAWPGEKCPSPHWMTRAFENGVYVVAANRIGTERGTVFSGGSCILDPDGSIQAMVDNEQGIVCGYVDLTRTGGKRCAGWPTGDRFADRRPEMYHGMVLNSYLWNPFLTGSLYNRQGLPPGKRSLVLAVQMRTPEDPAVALANVEALLAKFPPRDAEPDLVVLPELFSVGELATGDTIRGRAEPLSGPLAVGLERLAARWHVYLVAGLAELESGHFYNTAALFGPEGRLVGKYRKLHLDRRDREWADPGNLGLPVFDLPAGRVGLLIGYDALFPELARCLALAGVDIICCPSSVPGPRPIALGATAVSLPEPIYRGPNPTHWHLWRCRAGENGVYVIFANQWGKNSMGYSGIFHPDYYGYPRHEAVGDGEGDSVLALEVDTRDGWSGTVHLQNWLMGNRWAVNPVRTKDYLRLRQPYWYDIFVHRRPPVLERQLSCPMTRE
ncbi:MAG TPA: amidohydrolase, partial [Firmicutes bacterium]|nr:amidohydrolase [Bacillota bacterium]